MSSCRKIASTQREIDEYVTTAIQMAQGPMARL